MKNTISHNTASGLQKTIISWYSANYRKLPWRETRDPYRVWLSEIILQQTRVSQGLPYYERFVTQYPTIEDFAAASEGEVLKLWQGLGYYSRARNMLSCAHTVMSEHNGQFPSSYKELLKLKGIGKYTAAAIASICFDEAVPSIDGNVFRVFSRVFGITNDISDAKTFSVFFELGGVLINKSQPGMFNQAVMELGATVCSPKKPTCEICPLSDFCFAKVQSEQLNLPVKTKKVKVKNRNLNYLVFGSEKRMLIRTRNSGDIWTGLTDFYCVEEDTSFDPLDHLASLSIDKVNLHHTSGIYDHILTHQKLKIRFFVCQIDDSELNRLQKKLNMQIVEVSEIDSFAVPKPIEQFLKNEYLLLS